MWAVAEESEDEGHQGNAWKFSGRFCKAHNPSDPTSRYRVDHRYRQRFQEEVKRQWGLVKRKETPWEEVPDEVVVRKRAIESVRMLGRTRADEMREIAEQFGVSRQTVYKVLVKNI